MRRLSPLLTTLLVLVALLFAPRPARACTEHRGASSATVATLAAPAAAIPASARATTGRPTPTKCCAGAAGCEAPMPCCVASPGTIPPALAATRAMAEATTGTRCHGSAHTRLAPDRGALPPEPPPPRA